jgi:hypothetical protein
MRKFNGLAIAALLALGAALLWPKHSVPETYIYIQPVSAPADIEVRRC